MNKQIKLYKNIFGLGVDSERQMFEAFNFIILVCVWIFKVYNKNCWTPIVPTCVNSVYVCAQAYTHVHMHTEFPMVSQPKGWEHGFWLPWQRCGSWGCHPISCVGGRRCCGRFSCNILPSAVEPLSEGTNLWYVSSWETRPESSTEPSGTPSMPSHRAPSSALTPDCRVPHTWPVCTKSSTSHSSQLPTEFLSLSS